MSSAFKNTLTPAQGQIFSLDYIELYINRVHPHLRIKAITPYSFTVGSNNDGEGLPQDEDLDRSLLFGTLFVCINPNGADLAEEKIEIKYRSYFNTKPYVKRITRIVELENYVNESSQSTELFDQLTITQTSNKYDFYLTFVGFKIDYA